jgi:hypothetical protein
VLAETVSLNLTDQWDHRAHRRDPDPHDSRLFNYIVAIYLIIIGLIQIFDV